MKVALLIIFCYLLGSVPFGILFTRAKGIDLRVVGSGNIGATNVLRAAGRKTAVLTLLGDLAKGSAAVALAKVLGAGPLYEGISGLAAVIGHDFSVFLRFRGGKGVATSLGAVLIYAPQAGILTVVIWLSTVLITRVSSMGAVVSFAVLPFAALLMGLGGQKLVIVAIISTLLLAKHAGNIWRIFTGTERKVGEKA